MLVITHFLNVRTQKTNVSTSKWVVISQKIKFSNNNSSGRPFNGKCMAAKWHFRPAKAAVKS